MLERRRSREQLVGRRRQRVLIGPAVDVLVGSELLGRRIGNRADRHVRAGERTDLADAAGNTEVRQQDSLVIGVRIGDQDVGRFDVAVQQTAGVRVVERLPHGGDDAHHQIGRHAVGVALGEQPRRVGALDVVHRQPQPAVEVPAVVDRHDVRMPQRGRDIGLPVEPLPVLGVSADRGREHLERIVSGQPWMACQIHLTHAPRAQQPHDGVARDHVPVGQRHPPTPTVR